MARRYKPLPAGQIVWRVGFQCTAEVISDDGSGQVHLLERNRLYDYKTRARRSLMRPATAAEAEAHRQLVAQYVLARVAAQQAQLQAALDSHVGVRQIRPDSDTYSGM